MFPFFWPTEVKFPGAEGNYQTFAPQGSLFSPTTNVTYQGAPDIEIRVANEVASNGKQLGIITDALLELAGKKSGEALDKLREIHARIEEVKQRTRAELKAAASTSLDRLVEKDPASARALAEQLLRSLDGDDAPKG